MDRPTVIAVTPPQSLDPGIAIAACRAGALGVLDLEYACEDVGVADSLERLERFTSADFGVKLRPQSEALLDKILRERPPRLRYFLIAGGDGACLRQSIPRLREGNVWILAEAATVDEARRAADEGVDGIVLKGNESGGRVGEETSLILLQHWVSVAAQNGLEELPFWIQGGVGSHSAAACVIGGAAGVVLDAQLLLTREARAGDELRLRLQACDGSETVELGRELGAPYRILAGPQSKFVSHLQCLAVELSDADAASDSADRTARWHDAVAAQFRQKSPGAPPFLCGQDSAFAKSLADRFVTVGGVVEEMRRRIAHNRKAAAKDPPFRAGAPLAKSHGTRYPLLQGPMTRVSDTAAFATAVADAGALPFLALALLRGPEAKRLIAETAARLGDRPWGVGVLGFLPAEIREEQIEAILAQAPPFALIAGGRPDQARRFEEVGVATYLHVPSPGLLKMFLRDGAKRFIFEGRECGGHVGPRSSFVLWESMCEVLLEHLGPRGDGGDLHVAFAGGVHDALSGAMLSGLAVALAERGVKVGALMGTAYLFTREAVASQAIVPRFQREVLAAEGTVLFETGPGHAVRCARTPYFDAFNAEKRRLQADRRSHREIVQTLELMNLGRLRVASKGLQRVDEPQSSQRGLTEVGEDQQYRRGMYMIGQVAALRNEVTSMAALHEEVCTVGSRRLTLSNVAQSTTPARPPCDTAVVGMSAFYPGALGLEQYWENILWRHNAVTEIPHTHWDWRLYYDENPATPDRTVSKWGGFLGDVAFDPLEYGIAPNSLPAIEPLQLLVLEGVRRALRDAGYERRPFDRENTCTVLGTGGSGSAKAVAYGLRACLPMFDAVEDLGVSSSQMLEKLSDKLPEWTEDSFPGILLNVAAGRVANRFDLGGANYAVDAACASSLAAVHAGIRELELGTCNVAVAIGADTVQTPYAYVAFSKTRALSPKGRCRPFDADADGIVLSEGVGVVILKRLADAERDGDRIYAVIKGVGASSDGMDMGLTAPNSAGQTRAIRRAFDVAGFSPADITLLEAHGTGTVVGDRTEAQSLSQVMQQSGADVQSCAVGSVKSMIGHAKCAAGMAGFIKTVKALECKTLPPTLVDTPNPHVNFADSALYLNTEPRPWVHRPDAPRRAGVSSFGFGGTNVHVVVEEYRGDFLGESRPALKHWPAELLVWQCATRTELAAAVSAIARLLENGTRAELRELAEALGRQRSPRNDVRAAIVAASIDDLQDKLAVVQRFASGDEVGTVDPRGVYCSAAPVDVAAKVAFLFPGQGSQYPNMLAQLAMNFPVARQTLDHAQQVLADKLPRPLTHFLYPPSPFSERDRQQARQALAATETAQPALGAASVAVCRLLSELGLEPHMTAGHSYGEFTALWSAGVLTVDELLTLSHLRGRLIREATLQEGAGGMAAIHADASTAASLADGLEGVSLANVNAPDQIVLSASQEGLEQLLERAGRMKISAQRLPVACAFHSPLVAGANKPLAKRLRKHNFGTPDKPVYSNVTAAPYGDSPEEIRATLSRHLTSPVQFVDQIEAMYRAGARVFIEAGPNNVLTGLTKRILGDKQHLAVAVDAPARDGLVQLAHALGQLFAEGMPLRLEQIFQPRQIPPLDLSRLDDRNERSSLPPSTWLVNGVRSRVHNAPEPQMLGTRTALRGEPNGADGAAREQRTPPQSGPQRTAAHPPMEEMTEQRKSSAIPDDSSQSSAAASRNGAADAATVGPRCIPPDDEAAQVVLGFQDLMAKFLDTQREVMSSYLSSGGDVEELDQASSDAFAAALRGETSGAEKDVPPGAAVATPNVVAPIAGESTSSGDQPTDAPALDAERAAANASDETDGRVAADWADIESIGAILLDLLSERTGYPKEMLDLDLDLEADLGIDSIKRVEIVGGLTEHLNGDGADLQEKLDLETLTSRRSLRAILEYLHDALADDADAAVAGQSPEPDESQAVHENYEDGPGEIQRGLVRLVEAPLEPVSTLPVSRGAILLTDDGAGVAREIAGRLAELGQPTALLTHVTGDSDVELKYGADLTDPASVADVVRRLRKELGSIGGLIHALPLAQPDRSTDLIQQARRDVRSLYLLARELEADLLSAGEGGNAFLLAATALGGELGYGQRELPHPSLAAHGGILGFVKCVGLEWPAVLVRAVDLDASRPVPELVECLVRELSQTGGPLEVGYRGARRLTWQPYAAPLEIEDQRVRTQLSEDAVVLVTGGARGITAEIAAALAQQYRPNLVLIGRSPRPADSEDARTAGLTDPAEIKQALIAGLVDDGGQPSPGEIESLYQKLLRDREMRANFARLNESGAKFEYHSMDVCDAAELAELIAEVVARYGAIDGVVHGAGVIEDKLLRDKTPESFDRVFDVKVKSALALSKLLEPHDLKFCVFFTSIANRYGNRGQSDYAAANEVVSKLALELDRRWPARVLSIAWGPWKRIGMVAELETHLAARGVALIDPAVGAERFVEELEFGWKGESEILIAGSAEQVAQPPSRVSEQADVR